MKKTASLLILSVLMMTFLFTSQSDLRIHADSSTLISFSEPSYLVAVNKPFNVTVMMGNVSDLSVWQVGILFDTSVMQYVTVTAPSDNIFGSRLTLMGGLDHAGLLTAGAGRLPLDPDFTGSGRLVTVTFIMNTTGTATLAFDTSGSSPSYHFYTFLINSRSAEIAYSVAGCSIRSLQYLPDVNNDGIVNMKDVMSAVLAFNSFPNTSRWNVYADVDGNGHIDMKDLVLTVANFGMRTASSGGIPGIEKLEFSGFYAETTNDGWIVHVVINNTGSTPIMIDNSTVLLNSYPLSFYQTYARASFGQVTLQPGDMTDLQFLLLGGSSSPWNSGSEIYLGFSTTSGGWYATLNYRSLYLP